MGKHDWGGSTSYVREGPAAADFTTDSLGRGMRAYIAATKHEDPPGPARGGVEGWAFLLHMPYRPIARSRTPRALRHAHPQKTRGIYRVIGFRSTCTARNPWPKVGWLLEEVNLYMYIPHLCVDTFKRALVALSTTWLAPRLVCAGVGMCQTNDEQQRSYRGSSAVRT